MSLPPELISAICEELDLRDLQRIRLTCKAFANIAASLVLSHIIISDKWTTTFEQLVSDLQFLTSPERPAVACASEITFRDFSSIFERSNTCKGIKECFTALTSFKMVRTVNWYPGFKDPFFQEFVWKAILVFPNLHHVSIHCPDGWQPPLNFDSLNKLESIHISGAFHYNLVPGLSKFYASSSKLNSIAIEFPEDRLYPEPSGTSATQQLFSSSPRSHPLRCLSLCNVPVCLDDISVPHLTHLTSFKLSHLPYNSSPDGIWVAFRRSEIYLEELEVGYDAMADSFNDYLSSFSGLKKLSLTITEFESQASEEASAIKFWSDGFPNHVDTIQEFSLIARYGGQWCFGHHNHALLEKCIKLKQLTISLLPNDIPSKTGGCNEIDTLMDMVLTRLPHAKQLQLLVAIQDVYRGSWYRCESQSSRYEDMKRLEGWIWEYKAPASCQSLPELTVGSSVFVGTKMGPHSRLGYWPSKDKKRQ